MFQVVLFHNIVQMLKSVGFNYSTQRSEYVDCSGSEGTFHPETWV